MANEWDSVAALAVEWGKPQRTVRNWTKRLPPEAKRIRPGLAVHYHAPTLLELIEGRKVQAAEKPEEADGKPQEAENGNVVHQYIASLERQLAAKDEQIARHQQAEAEQRRLMLTDRQELQDLRHRLAIAAAPPADTQEIESTHPVGNSSPMAEKSSQNGTQRGFWSKLLRREA